MSIFLSLNHIFGLSPGRHNFYVFYYFGCCSESLFSVNYDKGEKKPVGWIKEVEHREKKICLENSGVF